MHSVRWWGFLALIFATNVVQCRQNLVVAADWCDYSGTLEGQHIGVTLFCHPENFRPSWFHARDYGLLEANPFGSDAFGKGPKSMVTVRPGERFRLRYGVLVHASPAGKHPDLAAAYADYLRAAGN